MPAGHGDAARSGLRMIQAPAGSSAIDTSRSRPVAARLLSPTIGICMSGGPLFWQRCLDAFRKELTPQQFNTWIRPLVLESAAEGYRLLAHNRFVLQWVKERFLVRITELAAEAHGHPVPITLAIADGTAES